MSESTLRLWIGIVLFLGNLLVAILVVCLTAAGGFTGNQQKLLLLVIGPMTVPTMTAAVRYFLNQKTRRDQRSHGLATAGEKLFGLGPVILFPVILSVTLVAKAFNYVIQDFDSLLIDIAVVEAAFGGIIALITQRFFAGAS